MIKSWYRFIIMEYPICGKSYKYKELIKNTVKPVQFDQRYIYTQVYDYCQEN